ncbi:hypothetical protein BESB_033970 [Besnoitia besnoiti]|uniref:SRS domain-containing protein n=1 Tax=Besnoitia besnoiti TaxID=94643 RepID=A0A2A9MG97_BESBE|nr:hypothetical protein BESB_033970 [Besnoitia besnoiti]PFH36939.1 hypothetical protein BESB_033970 [Besnoitia besnoiti]
MGLIRPAKFTALILLSGLTSSSAVGDVSSSVVESRPVQLCGDQHNPDKLTLTLAPGTPTISFGCSAKEAMLMPSKTKVYTNSTDDTQSDLSTVCRNATLNESPGVQQEPKTYTLSVPEDARQGQVLYWKCQMSQAPQLSEPKLKTGEQSHASAVTPKKDCTVQITVTAPKPKPVPSIKVHQCEPQLKGQLVTATLPKNTETLLFSCGSGNAELHPNPSLNKFYEDALCIELDSLAEDVCRGATLTVEKQGGPKTYKLTVPELGRQRKVLYYKCLATEAVLPNRLGGNLPPKNPSSCTLQITVDGPVDPDNDDDDLSPHDSDDDQDDQMDDLFETCEIDDDENKMEHITLPSKRKRVGFSCGTAGAPTLTPEASENKFCVDPSCSEQKLLSSLFPGATFVATPSSGTTIYSLSFKSKPRADHELYYVCTATKAVQDRDVAGAVEGTQKKRKCTVKLTIKGRNSFFSAGVPKAVTSGLVAAFISGLLYMRL